MPPFEYIPVCFVSRALNMAPRMYLMTPKKQTLFQAFQTKDLCVWGISIKSRKEGKNIIEHLFSDTGGTL